MNRKNAHGDSVRDHLRRVQRRRNGQRVRSRDCHRSKHQPARKNKRKHIKKLEKRRRQRLREVGRACSHINSERSPMRRHKHVACGRGDAAKNEQK